MVPENNTIVELFRGLHTNPEERADAIATFRSFESDGTIRKLSEFLNQTDPDTICDAAYMIMMIDSKRGTNLVLPLMRHVSNTVRSCACCMFIDYATKCDIADGQVVAELVNTLLTDLDAQVRLMAAHALRNIRDPATLPALQQALDNDKGADWEGRTVADAARRAIERITSPPKRLWS